MKTVRKNKILLTVAIALVLTLTIGLTMSYFSDHTQAAGGLKVTLGGETTIHEEKFDDHKDITIENTGDTDVVVRVAVYGPGAITYSGSADWTVSGDYAYYNKVLPAGQTTSSITATWVVTDTDDDYDVVVIHESAQAVFNEDGSVQVPVTQPAWAVTPSAN